MVKVDVIKWVKVIKVDAMFNMDVKPLKWDSDEKSWLHHDEY